MKRVISSVHRQCNKLKCRARATCNGRVINFFFVIDTLDDDDVYYHVCFNIFYKLRDFVAPPKIKIKININICYASKQIYVSPRFEKQK